MQAIQAIAKKTKSGKYKIDLPLNVSSDEVEVMVIVENEKATSKKTHADFAGKLEWKGDAVEYQKMMRNEWS